MNTYNKGSEVSMVAYNGCSRKTSKTEGYITGTVEKVTSKYIWIKNYVDGTIWKAAHE